MSFVFETLTERFLIFQIRHELNHRNVLKLYHPYRAFDKYYLVMELACGGDLFEDLVTRNAFSESTAREVMLQLFNAVHYIHGHRIVHRVSTFDFFGQWFGNK